ncbi:Lysine--tRNA ligase [Nymphon striatum]|nr:Lysine--tRNA ligase [Nymphon striatum]
MTDTTSSDSNNSENETEAAAPVTPTEHIIPYRFERDRSNESIIDEFGDIEDGSETGTIVTIAGRLMLRREQGKLAFGVLADSTGRMQLFARSNKTPDFDGFTSLSLGDWIGVTGQVMKTKRGELSISVDSWEGPGRDQAVRSPTSGTASATPTCAIRQRYCRPIRDFIEVETPVFHPIRWWRCGSPFITHHNALDTELYLRIASELYLKRLTVGGFERVFEIARVFRNEGMSTRHNPEFTMLELYQAYADYGDIMELVEAAG